MQHAYHKLCNHHWTPVFVHPDTFTNTLLTWICVAATDNSNRALHLKCANATHSSNAVNKTTNNKKDACAQNPTAINKNSCNENIDSRTMNLAVFPNDSLSTMSTVHVPTGSRVIPLHYEPVAWLALSRLKVNYKCCFT